MVKKYSRYDSDEEEETEEERAHREYAAKILNADAAGRADSDKLSEKAKKEIKASGKAIRSGKRTMGM